MQAINLSIEANKVGTREFLFTHCYKIILNPLPKPLIPIFILVSSTGMLLITAR